MKIILFYVYIIVFRSCICCLWWFGTLSKFSSNLYFFYFFIKKDIVHQLLNSEAVTRRYSVKSVFRNFAKFTKKHLRQSLFFNKVAGFKTATVLKKKLWHGCFPVNFVKFLKTPCLTEHLWCLLL